MEEIQANIDNILYQIKSAKNKGKKSIKVKVYQEREGKILYHMSGMKEGEDGTKYLRDNGYTVIFENNENQTSFTYNMKGELAKSVCNKLYTSSMVIGW